MVFPARFPRAQVYLRLDSYQGVKELKSLTFQLFDFRLSHPEILFFPASQLAIVLLKYE
jgi:hypothetical protein